MRAAGTGVGGLSDDPTVALLVDLAEWSDDTRDFHGDRNLADRVLLAADWRCIPDPDHPARVKWEFGTNPVCTCWDPYVPHPINSIDDAFGQMPFGWRVWKMEQRDRGGPWQVSAVADGIAVDAIHPALQVALCIAAVKAWHAR